MIVIKVWCLPPDQTEDSLNLLHKAIVEAVVSIPKLGVKDESSMVCLFPADLMKYGLGEEIIVEIDGLPIILPEEEDSAIREQLAMQVAESVAKLYHKAIVQCSVKGLDPSRKVWRATHQ